MGYKDIKKGDYVGKPLAARFVKAKSGTIGLEVGFEFKNPATDGPERLAWTGWLSEKAIDNTMKTLVEVLGFNGSKKCDKDGVLTDPKALNYGQDVKLVIDLEPNQDGTKHYPKIKFVNKLGGSAYASADVETVEADLAGLNFDGAFAAAKSGGGSVAGEAAPEPFFDESQVPF